MLAEDPEVARPRDGGLGRLLRTRVVDVALALGVRCQLGEQLLDVRVAVADSVESVLGAQLLKQLRERDLTPAHGPKKEDRCPSGPRSSTFRKSPMSCTNVWSTSASPTIPFAPGTISTRAYRGWMATTRPVTTLPSRSVSATSVHGEGSSPRTEHGASP